MIHVSIGAPLGVESLVFSFIQRLSGINELTCLDGPLQDEQDSIEPSEWLDPYISSRSHFFVIGYRYPPSYWKYLTERAASVLVICDIHGVNNQIVQIAQSTIGDGAIVSSNDFANAVGNIFSALQDYVDMIAELQSPSAIASGLLIPSDGIMADPWRALERIESFYIAGDVPLTHLAAKSFSSEAGQIFDELRATCKEIRPEIGKSLLLQDSSPARIRALQQLLPPNICL